MRPADLTARRPAVSVQAMPGMRVTQVGNWRHRTWYMARARSASTALFRLVRKKTGQSGPRGVFRTWRFRSRSRKSVQITERNADCPAVDPRRALLMSLRAVKSPGCASSPRRYDTGFIDRFLGPRECALTDGTNFTAFANPSQSSVASARPRRHRQAPFAAGSATGTGQCRKTIISGPSSF